MENRLRRRRVTGTYVWTTPVGQDTDRETGRQVGIGTTSQVVGDDVGKDTTPSHSPSVGNIRGRKVEVENRPRITQ